MSEQEDIDKQRGEHAWSIVEEGNLQTLDQAKAFARNWIVTAMQHAANEAFYRDDRDRLAREIRDVMPVIAMLSRDNAQLTETLTLAQARGTALIVDLQSARFKLGELYKAWPHWQCPKCRTFNGEGRFVQEVCRGVGCGEPRPTEVP